LKETLPIKEKTLLKKINSVKSIKGMPKLLKPRISIELILLILLVYLNILIYFTIKSNLTNNFNCLNNESIYTDLSFKLNTAMNKISKLNCNLTNGYVSSSGGWCARISGKDSVQHKTDERFAKALSQYLSGHKVASFGDGPGTYKEIFDRLKQVIIYDAFDGAPFCEEITNGNVKFLDLSVPIYHLNLYDWIISIEVGEHIPQEFEQTYLDNLVRHAKLGIVLSWSSPGQFGMSHVNERSFEYVKSQMELRNFIHDNISSYFLKDNSDLIWIKNNINVYKRK
jgi:hypothetical protein